MIDCVKLPHLPIESVNTVLVGTHDKIILEFIRKFCPCVNEINSSISLDERIAHHIDLKVLHLYNDSFIVDCSQIKLIEKMKSIGLNVIQSSSVVSSPYPNDCALNCTFIGDSVFACKKATDKKILEFASKNDYNIHFVNQGYAKCSMLPVDRKAFITDDISIFKKGIKTGFDCLLVEKGDVLLDGFNYGFIGGCASLIDKNHLLFLGDISKHKNFEDIKSFLEKHDCFFSFSESFPLTDIGSIIPFSYDCIHF